MPSYFSSSSSQSFYSSSSRNGQTQTHSFSQQTQTNPDGTTVRTAYRDNNKPVEYKEEHIPSNRQLGGSSAQDNSRRIEDVTDKEAEKRYNEAIEEEYAKREGGA